jgi:hypothetical protein
MREMKGRGVEVELRPERKPQPMMAGFDIFQGISSNTPDLKEH